MLSDYPELVSKLNLLINAGLNIHTALLRILCDYEKSHKKNIKFLYKELKITLRQIENGMSEGAAYVGLGKRIGLPCYIKFGSLLEQNLKKGNKELSFLLNTEVIIANDEKKRLIKKKGEEASTKLLLPMMMIFFVILILIMLPAFLNISM